MVAEDAPSGDDPMADDPTAEGGPMNSLTNPLFKTNKMEAWTL